MRHLHTKYQLEPEVNTEHVYDADTYQSQLQQIIQVQSELTVAEIKSLIEMGYAVNPEQCLVLAVNNVSLPFEVLRLLSRAAID